MASTGTTTHASGGPWRVGRVIGVRSAAGVVAAGLALAGCGGGVAEPTQSATWAAIHESPRPTPSPVSTAADLAAAAPERPAAMDTADSAGAEAAATYFLALYPYVHATNDLTQWRALSHPQCVFCASVVTDVEEQAAATRHSEGAVVEITSVDSLEVDVGERWTVGVELVQEPSRVIEADGAVSAEQPDTVTFHLDLAVIREDEQWLVRAVSHTEISRVAG